MQASTWWSREVGGTPRHRHYWPGGLVNCKLFHLICRFGWTLIVVVAAPCQVVDELVRTYIGAEGWSRLTLRNYHYNSALEVLAVTHLNHDHQVSWLVGPIPVEDGVGKEVILRCK